MLDIPIPGQLSPTGTFSYGRLLEINKCEKGIWAAVKHFFGRNVYLVVDIDNKIREFWITDSLYSSKNSEIERIAYSKQSSFR